ncbi:exopolyphosphatase [Acidihalobacter ferrooxydans]|uniref:Exopolyphosphatase n=1 Tax=Acidihalobacter ferrooxydans TaxID=1765967 RepID=A0A1P8UDN9_9GAMM|nr:exopolyphosphatase [Acidihalobacter ferrooxydans]APZ41908.1 exopolyphosphatase [Acidihalobacter ferrooxydans]
MKTLPPPAAVAAVDLGSNSFHMIVAQVEANGQLRVVDRLKEMVRLGGGLDEDSNLTPEAQQRALECLRRFGQRVRDFPPGSVRALGTNTLRLARNAEAFLAQASVALGHPIDIIAGREEARLVYLGVAHNVAASGERRLVVDIGGGSTELIVGEGFDALETESLHMGCVSVSQDFFPNGELSAKQWRRALTYAQQELRPLVRRYKAANWERALGASGTILSTERVLREAGWNEGGGITPAGLGKLGDALLGAKHIERIDLPGLDKDRAPVFAGGVAVLTGVFAALGIQRMDVSSGALREGALYDLLGRMHHEDIRTRAIDAFIARYQVDTAQAERVALTATQMFDAVADQWALNADDRDYLYWAARLHEVGQSVAHSGYHKHGEYLVANADLPGFSRHEQEVLALLVRTHRRKFNLRLFEPLPAAARPRIVQLAALLRLAVVIQRGRGADEVKVDSLAATDGALTLTLEPGWQERYPLTQADLENEQKSFKGVDIKLGLD